MPWRYQEGGHLKAWYWKTDHFEADIHSDGSSFAYRIRDSSSGHKRTIEEGRTTEFKKAQNKIVEVVAKSYPLKYGYRDYAGALATTFRISSGEPFDFGPYEGSRVILKVLNQGKEQSFTGAISVENYRIKITGDNNKSFQIPPHMIISVNPEYGTVKRSAGVKTRTVEGRYFQGCTGKMGYRAGTVDHPANVEFCPIHHI